MDLLPKPALRSRTILAATCVGILAALNSVTDYVQDARILSWVVIGKCVVDILLRLDTHRPIE